MARLTIDGGGGSGAGAIARSGSRSRSIVRRWQSARCTSARAPLARGTPAAGVTQPSPSWFFAEGATGPYFETFILLSNPNASAADVDSHVPAGHGHAGDDRSARFRRCNGITVNIEADAPALANAAVATQVIATQPIVAERAQYWPFTPDRWLESHASAGVNGGGARLGTRGRTRRRCGGVSDIRPARQSWRRRQRR